MKYLLLILLFLNSSIALSSAYVGSSVATFKTKDYKSKFETGLVVPKDFEDCVLRKKSCKVELRAEPKLYEGELPKKFDWRDKYTLPPIRTQRCGSCWAYAMTGVLESVLRIKGISTEDLSEQFLVGHDFEASGCMGGWMNFHMFKGNSRYPGGTMLEWDCPYVGKTRKCSKYSPEILKHKIHSWGYVDQSNAIPSTEKLKKYIYSYGPTSVAVSASGGFSRYSSGIFNEGGLSRINHAVILLGWDDTVSPGHWIMRNSWGSSWGEGGYMRLAYGSKKIGYGATYLSYDGKPFDHDDIDPGPGPDPQPDPEPTPPVPLPENFLWYILAIAIGIIGIIGACIGINKFKK